MKKIGLQLIRTKFRLLALLSKRKAAEKAFELFCTPLKHYNVKKPSVFGDAEKVFFRLNGLKIKGYMWGLGGKEKLLILHGFSSSAYKFHRFVRPLVEKGYEVYAFDAPAHGGSDGTTVNALVYSEMIEKINYKFGPFNSYIAHSFGGIGLSLAMEKLPHNELTRLALIAPATETKSAVDAAFELLQISDLKIRKEFDNIIFEKSGHPTAWFSINRAMKNIKASVLWVHDEDDETTPLKDALKVKEQNFPNIEFMITKGLGHRKIYHDKMVQNKIFQFL